MQLQDLISIRQEARAAVAEEVRLELWKLPNKVAERLEAYEARLAVHVAALAGEVNGQPQPASAPQETAAPAAPPSAAPAEAVTEESVPDLTDDVDDGGDLF